MILIFYAQFIFIKHYEIYARMIFYTRNTNCPLYNRDCKKSCLPTMPSSRDSNFIKDIRKQYRQLDCITGQDHTNKNLLINNEIYWSYDNHRRDLYVYDRSTWCIITINSNRTRRNKLRTAEKRSNVNGAANNIECTLKKFFCARRKHTTDWHEIERSEELARLAAAVPQSSVW